MIPVERLKEIALFAELDAEHLAHLTPLFHRVKFRSADVVTWQGDPGDAFYVLENGTLRVRYVKAGEAEQVLGYLTAPTSFGETSLLTGTNRDVTIDVYSPEADLLVLWKSEFDELLSSFPEMKNNLVISETVQRKLAQRLYPWLFDGEIVLVNTRRHWFALAERMVIPGLVSLALLAATFFVYQFFDPQAANPSAQGNLFSMATLALFFVFILWTLGAGAWEYIDWSNDYYIVTNKRVIHIEKVVFVFEEREEAPIEMVTNIIQLREGFWQRVLGFTDFRVETAGKQVDINFTYAPEDLDISRHIFEQMGRVKDRAALDKRERVLQGIRDDIRQRLDPEAAKAESAKPAAPAAGSSAGQSPAPKPVKRTRWGALGRRFGTTVVSEHEVIWRKHWVVLLESVDEPLAIVILLLVVGFLHASGIVPLRLIPLSSAVWMAGVVAVWSFLLLLALLWTWYQYEDWSNDIYRITDDRIVDVERSPLGFFETSRETTLDRVQDVSYIQSGFIANTLGYGNLIVETASAGRLMFYDIAHPKQAIKEIFRRRDAHRAKLNREKQVNERSQFLDWFMEYDRLVRERGFPPPQFPPPGEPQTGTPPANPT